MDPRYKADIERIVKSRKDEFTARDVADELRTMHPNGDKAGRGKLPNAREMSEYFRTNPEFEKTGRKGSPTTNHYRYNSGRDVVTELTPEVREQLRDQISEGPPAPMPEFGTEDDEMRAALEERMEAIGRCEAEGHAGGMIYQEPMMVCHRCGHAETFKDPLLDSKGKPLHAVRELAKDFTHGALHKMNNTEATQAYLGYMMMALCRDNSSENGHNAALRDTMLARACTEVMAQKTQNVEKVLKMNYRGQPRRNK